MDTTIHFNRRQGRGEETEMMVWTLGSPEPLTYITPGVSTHGICNYGRPFFGKRKKIQWDKADEEEAEWVKRRKKEEEGRDVRMSKAGGVGVFVFWTKTPDLPFKTVGPRRHAKMRRNPALFVSSL